MMVLLASPLWAAPAALSDADMDGVYAQGITIQNNSQDNDTFYAGNVQKSGNFWSGDQTNRPKNESEAESYADSGDGRLRL